MALWEPVAQSAASGTANALDGGHVATDMPSYVAPATGRGRVPAFGERSVHDAAGTFTWRGGDIDRIGPGGYRRGWLFLPGRLGNVLLRRQTGYRYQRRPELQRQKGQERLNHEARDPLLVAP